MTSNSRTTHADSNYGGASSYSSQGAVGTSASTGVSSTVHQSTASATATGWDTWGGGTGAYSSSNTGSTSDVVFRDWVNNSGSTGGTSYGSTEGGQASNQDYNTDSTSTTNIQSVTQRYVWGTTSTASTNQNFSFTWSASTLACTTTAIQGYFVNDATSTSTFVNFSFLADPPYFTTFVDTSTYTVSTYTAYGASSGTSQSSSTQSGTGVSSLWTVGLFTTASYTRTIRTVSSTSTSAIIYSFGGSVTTTASTNWLTLTTALYTYLTSSWMSSYPTTHASVYLRVSASGDWYLPGSRTTAIRGSTLTIDSVNVSNDWLFSNTTTSNSSPRIQDWIASNTATVTSTASYTTSTQIGGSGFVGGKYLIPTNTASVGTTTVSPNWTHSENSNVGGYTFTYQYLGNLTYFTITLTVNALSTASSVGTVFSTYSSIPYATSSTATFYDTVFSVVSTTVTVQTGAVGVSTGTSTMTAFGAANPGGSTQLWGWTITSSQSTTSTSAITATYWTRLNGSFTSFSTPTLSTIINWFTMTVVWYDGAVCFTGYTFTQSDYTTGGRNHQSGGGATISGLSYTTGNNTLSTVGIGEGIGTASMTRVAGEAGMGLQSSTFGTLATRYTAISAGIAWTSTIWSETTTIIGSSTQTTTYVTAEQRAMTSAVSPFALFNDSASTKNSNAPFGIPFGYSSFGLVYPVYTSVAGLVPAAQKTTISSTRTESGIGYVAYNSYSTGVTSSVSTVASRTITDTYIATVSHSGQSVTVIASGFATFKTSEAGSIRLYSKDQRTFTYGWTTGTGTATGSASSTAAKAGSITTTGSYSFTWSLIGTSTYTFSAFKDSSYAVSVNSGAHAWGEMSAVGIGPLGIRDDLAVSGRGLFNLTLSDSTGGTTSTTTWLSNGAPDVASSLSYAVEINTMITVGGAQGFTGTSFLKYPEYSMTSD